MRAIVIGLLGAVFICGFTYFNDCVLHQSLLISDHMPVVIYGGLIAFAAFLNPLLNRLRKRWALSGTELTIILAIVLASCTIPAFGLMRTFASSLMLPHYHQLKNPAWKTHDIVGAVPENLLADPSVQGGDALTAFVQGMSEGDEHIGFSDIPWQAWAAPLAFWLPLVLLLWITSVSMALVFHPQWSNNEHLPYPIARFANAMLPGTDGAPSKLFRDRRFIMGCGAVLFIYAWNYAAGWFPQMIRINTVLNFRPMAPMFDTFVAGGGMWLLAIKLRFMPIGFAYLLAGDVAFSLGAGPFLWCLLVGLCASYGVSLESGSYIGLKTSSFINFGAYVGIFAAMLYCGRHHYLSVTKRAFGGKTGDDVPAYSVWGMRVFCVCALLFVVWLTVGAGLDWQLSTLYAAGAIIIFAVMGRVCAETGLFFVQVWTFPCVILWGLMGPGALGPSTLAVLFLVTCIVLLDPREALMPYIVNSLRLSHWHDVKLGKLGTWCVGALVLGLLVAVPITLYFQYDAGLASVDNWTQKAAGFPFENALSIHRELSAQGSLETAEALSGFERFAHIRPLPRCAIGFAFGLGAVLLFSAARMRYTNWPLHPVLFVMWGTFPGWRFAGSFLIGWLIRTAVIRFGGARLYRRWRPLMMGLIAGEILGYMVGVVAGLAYYFITGDLPRYSVSR